MSAVGALFRGVLAWGIAALLAGCGEAPPSERYLNDPAALKRGMGLFTGTCGAYCHSMKSDVGDAPFLFDCQWKNGSGSDADVFCVIYDGVPGTRMVGFGGKMPEGDEDIWKIVAFLRSRRESCA